MQKSGKLELTWVGKYEEKEIEPRILVENPELSYGDQDTGNLILFGKQDRRVKIDGGERNFRATFTDKANISKYVFTGYKKSYYAKNCFDSEILKGFFPLFWKMIRKLSSGLSRLLIV